MSNKKLSLRLLVVDDTLNVQTGVDPLSRL